MAAPSGHFLRCVKLRYQLLNRTGVQLRYRLHGQNNCSSITFQWNEASSSAQSILRYETLIDNKTKTTCAAT